MSLFTDRTQGALERALDGVSLRQRVAADNVANVMTPNFRARTVAFEGALSNALAQGDPQSSALSVRDSGGAAREDGNTVLLEDEMQTLMTSGLQYQALAQATSFKLGLWRSAITGS